MKADRSVQLYVRTKPETKAQLKYLAELKSKELGTHLTMGQAMEMLIAEALKKAEQ